MAKTETKVRERCWQLNYSFASREFNESFSLMRSIRLSMLFRRNCMSIVDRLSEV